MALFQGCLFLFWNSDVTQRPMSLFRRSEVTGAVICSDQSTFWTWDGIKKRFKHNLLPANLWGADLQWLHFNSRGRQCSHFCSARPVCLWKQGKKEKEKKTESLLKQQNRFHLLMLISWPALHRSRASRWVNSAELVQAKLWSAEGSHLRWDQSGTSLGAVGLHL